MPEALLSDGVTHLRPAWAEVDLDAVAANVAALVALAAPAEVCAVVKADGYGHGALAVARAALDAGATWLAVALPAEGRALRDAGIDARILLLSEPDSWEETLRCRLTPTVHRPEAIASLGAAVRSIGGDPVGVHLKVDTGMHRIGCPPGEALARARAIVAHPGLRLEAVYTHCPVADEPDNPFTARQAERFDAVVAELRGAGVGDFLVHAANSAATLVHPSLRHDLVRCGIAVYGLEPSPALRDVGDLRPALSLKSRVSHVQHVAAGVAVSYGLRRPAPGDTVLATVPLGYADGVPRRLFDAGVEVLVGGRRCRLAGNVTMDQILVDCGPGSSVEVGDEVVLLGRQGDEEVPVRDWADRLGTITYEIVCGLSPRVPRVYLSRTIGT
ncbi:MAG: Alanine racemase [Ilumatobacteraceae bacterium]|nr:Alanine racemase [Ilumatobacteraceae bacterium]